MRYFLEREIANLHAFLKTLDKGLETNKQKVSKHIDAVEIMLRGVTNDDDRRKEFISLRVEAEQVKGFTNLLRQSFLVSLYSFMELWLMRECYLSSQRNDSGKSYKATTGTGIKKAKQYFKGTMKSDYPFGSSKDWTWIRKFQLLRDCIIHRQGSLTGFSSFAVDSTLVKFIKNEQGLSLFGTDNQQIFVEYDFCLKALQIVHRFMIEILALK